MDSAGMLAMFQRSVEQHNAHYVEFLGDGDSKAHNLLVQENVYGDREIAKLECVGHVQKQLGSHENHTNGYPFEPFKPFPCHFSALQEWHEAVRMAVNTHSKTICMHSNDCY